MAKLGEVMADHEAIAARLVATGRADLAEDLVRDPSSESADFWFNLGAALQTAGEAEPAIRAYRIALDLNYAHTSAHLNLAGLLAAAAQYRTALLSYKAVMKHSPERADLALAAAEAAWRLGRPREAHEYIDRSLAAGHQVARCLDLKARLTLQDGQFEEVIRIAEASWATVETDGWARHAMRNAYDSALYALGRGQDGPISGKYPEITLEAVRSAWAELGQRCPNFAASLPIHVIGDSHATFFTGLNYHQFCGVGAPQMLPAFRAFNVGPSLAYTLDKPAGAGARQRPLFQLLSSGTIAAGAAVMLTFGEIDGRVHVLRQAEKQGRTVQEVQRDAVEAYMAALEEVARMGFRPMVWAPVGGMPEVNPHPELYPCHGTMVERNRARWDFIQLLADACARRRIPIVGIFRAMVNEAMETDASWLMDGLHLSQRAMVPTVNAFHALFSGSGAAV